jgi:enoyl-CoA hydratase
MSELVLAEDRGPVRLLTLNRPEKLNALSGAMVERLADRLADAAGDDGVRVLVLRGAGRSFCAGYDLSEESGDTDSAAALATLGHDLDRLLEVFDHPKPIIASVNGHCLAGGCDLMMMCDLAVASEDAVFGQPEIRFGSAVVAHVMPWLIGARRAKELVMTGNDRLSAFDAERMGLINRVVAPDRLDEATMALAGELAVADPVAMMLAKRAINRSWEAAGFKEALRSGVELGAAMESVRVPQRREFDRIAAEQGLREALRWRDSRYD